MAVIRDYLEWQKAVHGGGDPVAIRLHSELVAENRPRPTVDEALLALAKVALERVELLSLASPVWPKPRPRPDYDPHLDHPERYREGPV